MELTLTSTTISDVVTEIVTSVTTTSDSVPVVQQLNLINTRLEFIVSVICFLLLLLVFYGLYRFLNIFL